MNSPLQPNIPIIQSSQAGQFFDIYSRLLTERIIFLKTELTEETANLIIAQMLFLEAEDPEKDITLYINCSGTATAAMTVYDTMKQIRADVSTVCIGSAAAMGAFLLSSGTKGKRYALPNARIKLQQLSGTTQGKATDIEVAVKEILYLKEVINTLLAEHTGKSKQQIEFDLEKDLLLSAEEAKAYGLIDSIVSRIK